MLTSSLLGIVECERARVERERGIILCSKKNEEAFDNQQYYSDMM